MGNNNSSEHSDRKPAEIIDGVAIAATIRAELKELVVAMKEKHGKAPGLAVIIVGERKDSQTYVRMKRKACEEVGITSFNRDLPDTVTTEEVKQVVQEFNDNPDVHGILVQLPLPKHVNEFEVLNQISMDKDVDGFGPENMGLLSMRGREAAFVPCTPRGCIELLDRSGVEISGKQAVVIGRSNIVGMPAAMLLMKRNATVTIVHSGTKEPASLVKQADIIIAAAGQARGLQAALVKKDWIKPGAVVIDVGTNPVDDATKKAGYRLVGDVDFEEAKKVASKITPVPGGVGPMTIAMLMKNTVEAAGKAFISPKGHQQHAEALNKPIVDKPQNTSADGASPAATPASE